MRKFLVGVVSVALVASLTACGNSEEISTLNNMQALSGDAQVSKNYSLSWTDEQNLVYAQVSNRQLLDLSVLDACTESEIQQVRNFMDSIDSQLTGGIDVMSYTNIVEKFMTKDMVQDNAVIDTFMTDYLLAFFEKTPYYWQRYKTTIRGIDPSSRSIVVDVSYKTINFNKNIEIDSTIVRGEPNYDTLMHARYAKWTEILGMRVNNPENPDLPILENQFVQAYGDPEVIIDEQRVVSNTEAIFESGNQRTYSGVIDSAAENSGGICTVRYILVPKYAYGINLGLTCTHLYITDYKLDNDVTAGMSAFTEDGYQTITDAVYDLIYSYFTCIDESDFNGLYKLTTDFQGLDKYYQDIFDSTYQKHDGFSVSLFDITGTHITCGVTISTKERAKNSNMTFPIYTDRYYVEINLVDDTLKISNLVHLSRVLEGEPAIATKDVDETGFTATIDLNNDDRKALEQLICNFGSLQLLGDTTSDNFANTVDISMSTNQLSALKEAMTSVKGKQKVTFLLNYQQGTSNYASIRCQELAQDEANIINEYNVTYEFILKGGRWYVYNYTINSDVRLDTTNLNTKGCLCLVSPGKVDMYNSQITSTEQTNLENVSDISVSFDHEEYTPTLKVTVQEQGYRKMQGEELTEALFNEVVTPLGTPIDFAEFTSIMDRITEFNTAMAETEGFEAFDVEGTKKQILDFIAILYNYENNRYTDEEILALTVDTDVPSMLNSISLYLERVPREYADVFNELHSLLETISLATNRIKG